MNDLRTAAQQALEALKYHVEQTRPIHRTNEAIDALRAALEKTVQEPVAMKTHGAWDGLELLDGLPDGACLYTAPPQQAEPVEPVVGVVLNEEGRAALVEHGREEWHCAARNARRLYTAPPQRKPLTDEKISDLWCEVSNTDFVTADTHVFARAVERAHGIGEKK